MSRKQSPCDGKRPQIRVKALAQQHSIEAFERLVELVRDKNSCVALAASRTVLDRAHGKVPMPLKHEGKPRVPKAVEPPLTVRIMRFGEEDHDAG